MPAFMENKLKAEYAGQDPSIPFKIMNKEGLMRGNKETAKGRAAQAKHDADQHAAQAHGFARMGKE